MSKAHRLKTRKVEGKAVTKNLPLNFLLGCPQDSLGSFELARLAEIADLRKELHVILDRTIDAMAQATLASWFKSQDRNSLKHAIENEESPEEWAVRMIREGQRSEEEQANHLLPMPSPSLFRPSLPPGQAHLAAAIRYQERNLTEGKCRYCPKPLARHSVDKCEEHLAQARERKRQKNWKKGVRGDPHLEPGTSEYLYGQPEVTPSTHGRQLGTLASLAKNREKKTREVLAELGLPLDSVAVGRKAAKAAILRCLPPSKARAMTQPQVFQAATVPSRETGRKALNELLSEGKIQRIGKGGVRDVYRYFKPDAKT